MTAPTFPPFGRRRLLALGAAALAGSAGSLRAEHRIPGEYRGVVLFDRWDGCVLYDGVYLSYVAEAVKEELRPYAGRFVRLDVTGIFQPINPGDGRIEAFRNLVPYPGEARGAATEFHFETAARFGDDGPGVSIRAENAGRAPASVRTAELAPTLWRKRGDEPSYLDPSDGPSAVLITRHSFWGHGDDQQPVRSIRGVTNFVPYAWTVGGEPLPESFTLSPGESRRWTVTFTLPPGEYEFLCGYTGGRHRDHPLVSNPTAFDVAEPAGAAEPDDAVLPAP